MGGADFFCSVSGANFNIGCTSDTIAQSIYDLMGSESPTFDKRISRTMKDKQKNGMSYNSAYNSTRLEMIGISERLLAGLNYKEEDMEAARDFVLLCPCVTKDDGTLVLQGSYDDPEPEEFNDNTITEVFDIIPGNHADLGQYCSQFKDLKKYYDVGQTLIVAYSSYLILRQAALEVRPWMIYALVKQEKYTSGPIPGVDYGPVSGTFSPQYSQWDAICTGDSKGVNQDWPSRFWKNLLTDGGLSEDEKLHEAWCGDGNLWALVRPDRFPIAEAITAKDFPVFPLDQSPSLSLGAIVSFSSLPQDILLSICEFGPIRSIFALISTSRRLRGHILPHVNAVSFRRLREDEPWYLPAGPFQIPGISKKNGREDLDHWEQEWTKGGFRSSDIISGTGSIPWFAYRKACSESLSMRNRKRIWGIARQIERLAQGKGLLIRAH